MLTFLVERQFQAKSKDVKGYGLAFIFAALNIIYITYFLSTKKTAQAMVIACSRGLVVNSICIFLIPVFLGVDYIWIPIIMAELITLFVAVIIKRHCDQGESAPGY